MAVTNMIENAAGKKLGLPPGSTPSAAPNPYVRGPQYNNQFAQSMTDAQKSLSPNRPDDYWNPVNQVRRMEDDKPVTQSADFHRLMQIIPSPMDSYDRDKLAREAKMSISDRPGRHGENDIARMAAVQKVYDNYYNQQNAFAQSLNDAYRIAAGAHNDRASLHNAELLASEQNRSALAQGGLQAQGFAYGTDKTAESEAASRELTRRRDYIEGYDRLGPETADTLYPELAALQKVAGTQLRGSTTWEKLTQDNSTWGQGQRARVMAMAKSMGVPDQQMGAVLTRAGTDLTDKGIRDAYKATVLENQGLVKPGWGENEGVPIIDPNTAFSDADQPSQIRRLYNSPAGAAADVMAGPFGFPILTARRMLAGRQPGPDDYVVQTDQGKRIIRAGRKSPEINRFYTESQQAARAAQAANPTAPAQPAPDLYDRLYKFFSGSL